MQAFALLVDAAWYAARYRDVAEADALRHFVQHGLAEGRDPNPFFDGAWYRREYPDAASQLPLQHYLQTGAAELRDPHPRFDAAWYAGQHPDARGNPLLHYLRLGAVQGLPTEAPPDFAAFQIEPSPPLRGRGQGEGAPREGAPGEAPGILVITQGQEDPGELRLRITSRGVELLAPGSARALRLPPERIGDLVRVLARVSLRRVQIRHLPGETFDLRAFLRALAVPFDLLLRDYFALCPQRYLLPWPDAQHCGEPGPAGCNACIAARPSDGATDILTWRRGWDWLFREADRVICPSRDALARLQRYGLADRAVVPPSGGGVWPLAVPKLAPRTRLRVAVLDGAPHQGQPAIREREGYAWIHLRRIAPADWAAALVELRPHAVWFPGQWPDPAAEGLNAAIEAGLPIVAARIGSYPERLTGRRLTWLVDPAAPAQDWLEAFAAVRTALTGSPPKPARHPKSAEIMAPAIALHAARTEPLSVIVVPERFDNGTPTPCGYIRLLLPLDHLAQDRRIDLIVADPAEALRHRADLLITQRYAVPDAKAADALARHCREQGTRLVYDLDDDLLNIPRDHPEAAILRPRARGVARMLGHADAVWVSTDRLRQSLGAAGAKATVIANGLDERLWITPSARVLNPYGPVRVLYMGTATHDADFAMVQPALARLLAAFPGRVRFDLIGVTMRGDLPDWVQRIAPPASARASYPGFVDWLVRQDWDIGIAPLADTGFNRAKSAIKTLDYAALGLAVLASDVPAYQGPLAGLVDNTEAGWFSALARLIRDPGLRAARAGAAREHLLRTGTLAAQAEARLAALLAAAGKRVSPSPRGQGPVSRRNAPAGASAATGTKLAAR